MKRHKCSGLRKTIFVLLITYICSESGRSLRRCRPLFHCIIPCICVWPVASAATPSSSFSISFFTLDSRLFRFSSISLPCFAPHLCALLLSEYLHNLSLGWHIHVFVSLSHSVGFSPFLSLSPCMCVTSKHRTTSCWLRVCVFAKRPNQMKLCVKLELYGAAFKWGY